MHGDLRHPLRNITKKKKQIREVASSDYVTFVEVLVPFGRGLDAQFFFLYVARR